MGEEREEGQLYFIKKKHAFSGKKHGKQLKLNHKANLSMKELDKARNNLTKFEMSFSPVKEDWNDMLRQSKIDR